jgi:hypothetical protein
MVTRMIEGVRFTAAAVLAALFACDPGRGRWAGGSTLSLVEDFRERFR